MAPYLQPDMADMLGVHRIVESYAASRGDVVAVIGVDGMMTYRELNQRANALARHLIDLGLRRGSRAVVKMERCPALAVALLAVLKAGAAYTWVDVGENDVWPLGISLVGDGGGIPEARAVIDIRQAIDASSRPAANLPIVTRGHDIACVLPGRSGLPGLLVPHSTIAALQLSPLPASPRWSWYPGALDLWIPLMAGAPVVLTAAAAAVAA